MTSDFDSASPRSVRPSFWQRVIGFVSRPLLWIRDLETSGRFVGSLLLSDLLLSGVLLAVLNGYWLHRRWSSLALAVFTLGLALLRTAGLAYTVRLKGAGLRRIAADLLAAPLLPWAAGLMGLARPAATDLLLLLAVSLPLQWALRWIHRRGNSPLCVMLVVTGALGLGQPLLTLHSVGTGDAYWYSLMVGDFVTQWHAGIFPVLVGQSDYAFNGAINPLRFAPYLQHAAGVLDLLTGRTLPPVGLLNGVLLLSLIGGALTAYRTLRLVLGNRPWFATALALLFVSSPGVLALFYTGDLFMSACTLPYLPLVAHAMWLTAQEKERAFRHTCYLTAMLALLWLCHPPIAFWTGVVVAVSQFIVFGRELGRIRTWLAWGAGAAVFFLLSAYTFVSVFGLHLPPLMAEPNFVIQSATEAFPDSFAPVSDQAGSLSDYQLGWSLWLILLAGGVAAGVRRQTFGLSLLAGCAVLLLLLLPIPHVLEALWHGMPQGIVNLTNHWPMQRFYVILALGASCLGALTLRDLLPRSRWWGALLAPALLVGLAWSAAQAQYFTERAVRNTAPAAANAPAQAPQNRVLTRYAYTPFPHVPPYFSHGYVDPLLENRLLARDSFAELASNHRAAATASTIRASGPIPVHGYDGQASFHSLFDALPIEPGRHYALQLDFTHADLAGSLIVSGRTVQREYYLPDSAGNLTLPQPPRSFGLLPSSSHIVSLLSTAPSTETLLVQYVASSPPKQDLSSFGTYALHEFSPDELPVVIDSWTPYRARVQAQEPAWLETPRIFIAGYAATVNGRTADVARSPGGQVMVAVAPGENHVVLRYPGPLSLRIAYFLTLAGWVAFAACMLRSAARRSASPVAA